jgi:circadian clock protein KaiC
MDLRKHLANGRLTIQQIDPAELSPGQLAHIVRQELTRRQISVVVIDSLNGYLNAMPGERHLIIQLHEMLTFLGQAGVATILISAQHGFLGSQMSSPVDASYLADAVILLRYFEAHGEVRQAISVVKKRGGAHERTIREFRMAKGRIEVGEPLRNFRGILTGVPVVETPSVPAHDHKDPVA